MSTWLVTLIAVATFAAGYGLRGWLAVCYERKQLRQDRTGLAGTVSAHMPEVFGRTDKS